MHFKDQLVESGRQKTKENIILRGKFRLVENGPKRRTQINAAFGKGKVKQTPPSYKRRILKCLNVAFIRKFTGKKRCLFGDRLTSFAYSFTPHGLRNILLF